MSTNTGALEGMNTATGSQGMTMRQVARIGGILYVVIFAAGIFAEMFVRGSLIVAGDAATTASNILGSEELFRANIGADLLMIVADVAIALVFLVLLRPVNSALSTMAAFFRLTQAAVLGANLLNLVFALQLFKGADAASQSLGMLFLEGHAIGYRIALTFFAISVITLGYLVVKSDYFPSILGVLLAIAGLVYLGDTFANILMTNYAAYQPIFNMVVSTVAVIGELAMAVWLLVFGIRGPVGDETPSMAVKSEAQYV